MSSEGSSSGLVYTGGIKAGGISKHGSSKEGFRIAVTQHFPGAEFQEGSGYWSQRQSSDARP